ncbi:SA0570 family protein [Staphylococcus agnetis]|uniref:SA0570 family protein n=1 Tax=Staphylococcus agnetis TaxID=985762 RepID=UPI0021CF7DB1|nr:hypothetical protein [Staphylococcus agnetis]UXU59310.1 hypothetical protein MUA97_10585 [Staphylococcus agnetis]UXU61636.1 hypothetical protein MUA43_10585 [Staphylococcus agnetis]
MKKLVIAVLITGLTLSGVATGSASAMEGNTIQSVKALQKGDQIVEGVKIGQNMADVIRVKGEGIHTQAGFGSEQFYEYHTSKGTMIVTANSSSANAKVTRISMSYNKANGPTYKEVKKNVSDKAVTREHYNKVTGNSGFIIDGKRSYQFASTSPKDKVIKLYRIDLEG